MMATLLAFSNGLPLLGEVGSKIPESGTSASHEVDLILSCSGEQADSMFGHLVS